MSNYNPDNIKDPLKSTGDDGNSSIYYGSATIAANLTTADKVRPCRIAGGSKCHRVTIKNPDLDSGATLAVNIGFENIDGSAGPSATAIAAAVTTWQAAATTVYDLFPPVDIPQDAYLVVTPTVGGVGTGVVYAKAEVEANGEK